MVRQSKQTPDQKKDHKKRTQHQDEPCPKKPSDGVVWPCNINGCNKQFAREADLKRHQRTTKLHSVPGFACPQCDARFTRTDALRRHQKSRHNGVVIESPDAVSRRRSMIDEDPHSSASRSHSRSGTPSKENPAAHSSLPPIAAAPAGSQSYYRQHTFTGVMIPPGVAVDGNYSPTGGLPTSTRLHQASWQPAPNWTGDGSQTPLVHSYPHPYYNAPPHYYRPGTMLHPPDVAHQQIANGISSSSNGESSSSRQGSPVIAVDPSLDHVSLDDPSDNADRETVIDPSLVSPAASSPDHADSSADASRVTETRSSPGSVQHISSATAGEPPNVNSIGANDETTIVQNLLSPTRDHYSYPHEARLEHSLEMEQILTEDGEPMLNPAELLTQESLASPPPS